MKKKNIRAGKIYRTKISRARIVVLAVGRKFRPFAPKPGSIRMEEPDVLFRFYVGNILYREYLSAFAAMVKRDK